VGAGVYVLHLAAGLATRSEIELHVLTRRDDGERWRQLVPAAAVHALVPTRRPARLAWEQWTGPRVARGLEIDVWHGPHYTSPARVRSASVVTVHDLTFFDHPEWHERTKVAFFRAAIRHAARRASVIVAVSEHTATALAHLKPRGAVVVAPHGVDHERFRPGPRGDDDDIACLRSIGAAPPYVAFAGTLEPRKNVPGLVRAFGELARARPELRLVIAGGDGWGAGAVRDAVERSGAATRIVRPGYVPDAVLPALYRQAEVVAYPSLDEGFGLPVLEALACGAAVVTTSGTAMAEVANGAARLVPPGNISALSTTLRDLLEHTDQANRLREAGPRRASAFTWPASVDRHVEAYHLAVGR